MPHRHEVHRPTPFGARHQDHRGRSDVRAPGPRQRAACGERHAGTDNRHAGGVQRKARHPRRVSRRAGDRGGERRLRRYGQPRGTHGETRPGLADPHDARDRRAAVAGAAGKYPQDCGRFREGQGRPDRGMRGHVGNRRGRNDDHGSPRGGGLALRAGARPRWREHGAGGRRYGRVAGAGQKVPDRAHRPQGLARARPHRAPPRQVLPDRSEYQRHLRHLRGRSRDRAAARGGNAAWQRKHHVRAQHGRVEQGEPYLHMR